MRSGQPEAHTLGMAEQDEDRAAERAAILQRRARLVACAVMTGVCTAQGGCACLSPQRPEEEAGAVAGSGPGDTVDLSGGGEEAGGSGGAATAAGGEGGGDLALCLSVR